MKNPNTAKKLSEKLKGIPKSEKHKEKIRNTLKKRHEMGEIKIANAGIPLTKKRKKELSILKKEHWANPNSPYNSKETREKMALSQKAKWQNPSFDAKTRNKKIGVALKGRKITWTDKISKTRIELGVAKGEKNPNYKDGKSKEPYPAEWTTTFKEVIRKKNNYKCQVCGISQNALLKISKQKLITHHIDRNKYNLDEENLISVCVFCHTGFQKFQEELADYFYAINQGELPRK
jgi:hypothetical protein